MNDIEQIFGNTDEFDTIEIQKFVNEVIMINDSRRLHNNNNTPQIIINLYNTDKFNTIELSFVLNMRITILASGTCYIERYKRIKTVFFNTKGYKIKTCRMGNYSIRDENILELLMKLEDKFGVCILNEINL